jgi:protein-disulfide isomerase
MKKTLLSIFYIIFFANSAFSENKINPIYEGSPDAKIQLIIYESLTCSHCADFHKNVYPDLKENFIDKGYVKIEFRNFPLDMAALNASKIAHCKNDGKSDILHFLFENQEQWAKGSKIEDINSNLKKILDTEKYGINIDKCINNKKVEDHILEDRINAVKKFKLNATPTLIINNKKFDKPLNYKNLKKTLEKLI